MKRFAGLAWVAVTAVALLASCSKDESGTFAFNSPAVFLPAGDEVTLGFTSSNIQSYSVTSKPTGWNDPLIDAAAKTITIVSPMTFEDDVVESGSVVVSAQVHGGPKITATLFVSVSDTEDLSPYPANSYLVNKKQTNYLIDAMYKGDLTALATSSVDIIWQSRSSLIQYLELKDNKVSFFVGEDDDTGKIKQGNALIGAYDGSGGLIWSWHIWVADYDPEAADGSVDFNGYTMMTRNLGALAQSNASTDDILASYGLYYQWGRKDPFIGPSDYKASKGASAAMYNAKSNRVYMTEEASSAETGTLEYATKHPLTFITGVSESQNDWLWSEHSDALWSADNNVSDKTVYDPCPYGWRVAPAAAFDNLTFVNAPKESDYDKYGWMLGQNGDESLFIGAGRRRYDNAKILNVYNPLPADVDVLRSTRADEAQPWEGLYWTTGTLSGSRSQAYHFWFEKKYTAQGQENKVPYARANGMSVRCVKVRSR